MSKFNQFMEHLESLGIPIHGISSKVPEGSNLPVRIDFKDEATEVQRQQAVAAWQTLDKRIEADRLRQTKLAESIAAGYADNGRTYSLAPASLDNWQKLATSLRAEIDAGETTIEGDVTIFDSSGLPVETTANSALTLIAKISRTARLLISRDMKWSYAIDNAATEDELQEVISAIASS